MGEVKQKQISNGSDDSCYLLSAFLMSGTVPRGLHLLYYPLYYPILTTFCGR